MESSIVCAAATGGLVSASPAAIVNATRYNVFALMRRGIFRFGYDRR
jgi:hypothetical protein